ncbi:unnamed protein product [Strongylus vulgaris]|uniref:PTHB1 platform domain-containing protein n=1 Tax=Strongylus vulgaris TaxID=40348 RepID=A0A3P7K3D4_STRVU|nr:unnamed protein product [Strongylus vulgaris]
MLSAAGRLSIGYLGTEPNLYKVSMDNRFIDFKVKIQEMREIEASIKDSGNMGLEKKGGALIMNCSAGELEKATIEHEARQGAPICPLTMTFHGMEGVDSVKINIRSTLQSTSKQIVIDNPGTMESVKIPFFIGELMPSSTAVHFAAHCLGTQVTTINTTNIPFTTMFTETSTERNAYFKLTLDSDHTCVPLNALFQEFQTENPASIGFRVHGFDATVSVFTAHKSSRFVWERGKCGLMHDIYVEASVEPFIVEYLPISLFRRSVEFLG